ncbi:hypothetical protein L1987_13191 [Smallanthus sonchifolius]|uniref:Uncharacterized protein n=1 Tax=Smallanthus sonchifolius TaxID=185202 RepID=A0ACB9JGU9_9ASTR|nr:hypothetical protein L1987_13191 [Smallanthus sonchifolius]
MAELVHRHNGEKQIGCMSTFLQIFDRQQILARKRIHSSKRLPPSTSVGASPETESSGESSEFSQELEKRNPEKHVEVTAVVVQASPDHSQLSPAENEDVRPMSPAKDGTRSVIAKLMGLKPLTPSDQKPPQTVTNPAIPRSVSKHKVPTSRDEVHSKYIDGNNFQVKQPNQSQKLSVERIVRDEGSNVTTESFKSESSRSFIHSADFFPEPNQTTVILHGDFEKKLKMKGMDEQLNDLSPLKQILEVLQLKGLLNSTSRSNRDGHRNFVYDRNFHFHSNESRIHLKQWPSLASKVDQHRSVNDSRSTSREVDRSARIPAKGRASSPNRIESNLKSCNSIIKRKHLSIEIQRSSSIDSPKPKPKKTGSVHHSVPNRSLRNHKPTESISINFPKQNLIKKVVKDDESSSISESMVTDCMEGKRLLERCDKLLHSIAEMNSATESPPSSGAVLPSPVSVLDSGFDKDESWSPSHSIDFKATPTVDFYDENQSPKMSPTNSTEHEEFTSDDSDFIYISQILRASQHLREDPPIFLDTGNTSNVSKLHRKLVFDVIVEILDRNRELPPWKASIEFSRASLKQIWFEFLNIREIITGDSLLELIRGVLMKDLVENKDWGDHPIEMSEAILDIERMIFKDLVSDAIGELVEFCGECVFSRARRRLVF